LNRSSISIAIIPARQGSKRLPGKNKLPFRGLPMIRHAIRAAKDSGCFQGIIVSSDDPEIMAMAKREKVEFAPRPKKLAGDKATVNEVCLDVLQKWKNKTGSMPVHFCCLYPTAPLRTARDVRGLMARLLSGRCDFMLAATRYTHPPHQALRVGKNGLLRAMWPRWVKKRSQEVPQLVVDNGSTYAAKTKAYLSQKTFYGRKRGAWMMPWERSIDLDLPADMDLLRKLSRSN